jgi:hypothetical protein
LLEDGNRFLAFLQETLDSKSTKYKHRKHIGIGVIGILVLTQEVLTSLYDRKTIKES